MRVREHSKKIDGPLGVFEAQAVFVFDVNG